MQNDLRIYVPILKIDKDKRMAWGYCTTEAVDSQGEIVERKAIKDAWADYMKFANIREMHQASAVGITKEFTHDDKGTFIGVKVVDDRAWKFVTETVYKGFSIGGKILEKVGNRIKQIALNEISLVDRPANEEARLTVVKRNDGGEFENLEFGESDILKVGSLLNEFNKFNKVIAMEKDKLNKQEENPEEPKETPASDQSAEPEKTEEKEEEKKPTEGQEQATDSEEKKEEEKKEEEKVEEKVEEKKEEEPEKKEEEKKEEVAKPTDVKKDVAEVAALGEMAGNLKYLCEAFKRNGRDETVTKKMEDALDMLMECVQIEAKRDVKKVESFGDLQKIFGGEFGKISKQLSDFSQETLAKVAETTKAVSDLTERVDKIEKQPKADRPKTSFSVEKGDGSQEPKDAAVLKKELAEIEAEITKVNDQAKGLVENPNPSKEADLTKQLADLAKRFSAKKQEITMYFAQNQ